MLACLLLGCDSTSPAPPTSNTAGTSPAPSGPLAVTITDTSANFAGKEVPFPATRAQLVAALGEPSRTVDKVNKIFVWDQQGIYAYSKTDRDFVHDISFSFAKEEWDYAPQTTFAGTIQLGGSQITKNTTEADLTAAGFQKDDYSFEKSLGSNIVLVEHEGGIKSLSYSVP
jgi:hypothetical protein